MYDMPWFYVNLMLRRKGVFIEDVGSDGMHYVCALLAVLDVSWSGTGYWDTI